jgi:hypothetical protein
MIQILGSGRSGGCRETSAGHVRFMNRFSGL